MSGKSLPPAAWPALWLLCVITFGASCSSSSQTGTVASALSPYAGCGAGSLPEDALQGEVPLADRQDGRALQGYRCNLEMVGQYQGQGASWVNPSYDHCAYLATNRLGRAQNPSPGVQVIDASNPAAPVLTATLTSPAMKSGPWESLKVNEKRKLLGGAAGGFAVAAGFFDVYDLSQDCAHPRHLNALPLSGIELPDNWLGHEGNWSPDGMTYWSASSFGGSVTAIDVSDPQTPKILYIGHLGAPVNHGLAFNADGTRLYMSTLVPGGIQVYDVSDIQNRVATPAVTLVGSLSWADFGGSQHIIPVTYHHQPYLIVPSELMDQGIHFIDISDESHPKAVSQLQLQIQLPENESLYKQDTAGDGFFGYESHYCAVDRPDDPTALACGFFQSGVRVFNIVNPVAPHEIAYFNPPAQVGKAAQLPGSEHAAGWYQFPTLSLLGNPAPPPDAAPTSRTPDSGNALPPDLYADWCSSPPRFVGDQLWVTCQDNGFMILKFTNGVYPIR